MGEFDKLPVTDRPTRDPKPLLKKVPVRRLLDDKRLRKTDQIADKRIREAAKRQYRDPDGSQP